MADSRMDLILKKLNGEDVELVPPMSRIEKIYFKLLGYDIELDPPQSRSEVLLTEYVNNGGGGGGSSDFAIAHVTLINTSQDDRFYTVQCPVIREDYDYMEFGTDNVQSTEPLVLDVVLYKGEQYMDAWDWDDSIAPVITGDITYDSEHSLFIITGDGSISLVGTGQII